MSSGDLLDDLTNSTGSSRESSTDKGDAVMVSTFDRELIPLSCTVVDVKPCESAQFRQKPLISLVLKSLISFE